MAVAYRDQERIIGDSAKMQVRKNFANTILYFTRLAGLNAACTEQIEKEKRFLTNKIVTLENQKIGFEVTQMGQKYTFSVEQIIAFYLKKLKNFY